MRASCVVKRLEDREAARTGHPISIARRVLAWRLKVSPGTLENVRRGRTKEPKASLVEKVSNALVEELQKEMAALAHEIEILRQRGFSPRSDEILAAETHLAQARKLLGMK